MRLWARPPREKEEEEEDDLSRWPLIAKTPSTQPPFRSEAPNVRIFGLFRFSRVLVLLDATAFSARGRRLFYRRACRESEIARHVSVAARLGT